MTAVHCSDCGKLITKNTPKAWVGPACRCGDCLYRREQADAKRDERSNVVPIAAGKRASA